MEIKVNWTIFKSIMTAKSLSYSNTRWVLIGNNYILAIEYGPFLLVTEVGTSTPKSDEQLDFEDLLDI